MKTLRVPLLVVVVASIGLAAPLALASLSQGGASPLMASPLSRPAAILPQDIVNLTENGAFIPGGPGVTLFTVPANRWFIVRDCEIFWNFGEFPRLIENLGGTETTKRDPTLGSTLYSSLGLAFRPGSSVVMQVGSGGNTVSYSINGYLADP